MSRFKASKFKNATPKVPKKEFWLTEIPAGSLLNSSGTYVDASCELLAFNVDVSGGKCLAVLPLGDCGRKERAMPLLNAHTGFISDFQFSPFDDYLLATCSFDSTAKLWHLPEGGITESNMAIEGTTITAEQARIESLCFNPAADNVLALCLQKSVKVFDLNKMEKQYDLRGHQDTVQSMTWKADGSLLGTYAKDKKIRVFDPRTKQEPTMEFDGYGGQKDGYVKWRGETDHIIATGVSKMRSRMVGLWDVKNTSQPLQTVEVDNGLGTLVPFYDEDSDMVLLGGKGDSLLVHYDITNTAPHITLAFCDRLENQTKGMGMVPKRALDVMSCEVARIIQLTKNSVVPISVCVPRKSYRDFHADLFPETRCGDPAMSAEEWFKGQNKPMKRESLDPSKRSKPQAKKPTPQKTTSQPAKETAKPTTEQPKPSESEPADSKSPWQVNLKKPEAQAQKPVEKPEKPVEKPEKPIEKPAIVESKPQASSPSPKKKGGKFFMRTSKVRHVQGKLLHKNTFIENIRNMSISTPAESDGFSGNGRFVVVPLSGPGGQLAVFDLDKPGRLPDTGVPVLQNTTTAMDFELSPFDVGELAVGCDDGCVRVWKIPQGGLTETTDKPFCQMSGHSDKLNMVKYHTTAEHILATSSYDLTVKLWDIDRAKECITLTGHPDPLLSMAWKKDGKLLATLCKDKKLRLFDPRSKTSSIMEGTGIEGPRGARVCWVGPEGDWLFVSGFGRGSSRMIYLYDTRNGITLLNSMQLDTSPATLIPFYDEGTGIVFLTGKGDTKVFCYEVSEDPPHLFELSHYTPGGAHQSFVFLNKSHVNVREVEVDRALRITKTTVEHVQFTIPRVKPEFFQDDLFPDTVVSWESALSSSSWLSGENKVQRKISLQPSDMIKLSNKPKSEVKVKKIEQKEILQQKTDEEKKEELLTSMVSRVSGFDEPLPQQLMEGVDEDEWSDD